MGKIATLDVSNPLKILIYKSDYGQAVLLDNTLSEINRINLYENGYNSVPVMANSSDGNLWIYDGTDYKLKKISYDLDLLLESNSLRDYNLQQINPQIIIERNGRLVIQDKEKEVILFDNLGQYMQVSPFKTEVDIQFDGRNIIYLLDGVLNVYNIKLFDENTIPYESTKKSHPKNIRVGHHFIYLIYENGIDIIPKQS